MVGTLFRALWWLVSLPVRVLFRAVEVLGRATTLLLGFVLMVVGVALSAGSALIFGVPTFVLGLLLTLRALD